MTRPRRKPTTVRRVSRTERWLNLLAFLLDRRYAVTRNQILSEVDDYRADWLGGSHATREAVRRKFERDKEGLRALGIVIAPDAQKVEAEHIDQEVEAYRLRPRDLYLPYLELTAAAARPRPGYPIPSISLKPDDLAILRRAAERVLALGSSPLGAPAASALRKLSFDLPVQAGGDAEVVLTHPVGAQAEKVFRTLREGVERRLAVRCRYYAIRRDEEAEREIEPYGLMLTWGHWYCIGRARDRGALRVFRLDRMRAAALLDGAGARFEIPPGFSVQQYLDRAPWELSDGPATAVQVRIAFPHSRWTLSEGLGRVVEAMEGDGGAVLEFDVRAPEAFLRWLLPFGAQAEILGPAEFVTRLATERARVRALYA